MKRIVISGAVLALAIAGTGVGSAAPATIKITGGGQTLVPDAGGAGDTVGFNAQFDEANNTVKGQFQYVDRTGDGTGRDGQQYHGTVTCVAILPAPEGGEGGFAVFGGLLRDGVTPFRVDVNDNGQGEMGADMILVQMGDEARDGADEGDDGGPGETTDAELCDQEDETGFSLSRGNVRIHKEKGAGAGSEEQGGGKGGGLL